MARRAKPKPTSAPIPAQPLTTPSYRKPKIIVAAVLLAYFAALIFRADTVPSGINNDVAEEALRGLYLVDGHHFEVITFAIGNSAETLYLYLMGISAHLFGPTALAIHTVSWIFAIACVWMIACLAIRVNGSIPIIIPLLTAACSIWLFHYARSGLRAISAPFFLCAFTLLLDRVERRPAHRWSALACGAVLGLSLYSYTSARILPVAFAIFLVFQFLRRQASATDLFHRYLPVVVGAFIVSIPNLIFFFQHPAGFLSRGDYVFRGSTAQRLGNLMATVLLPLNYPDRYKIVAGPTHYFDGVSTALVSSGFSPIHLIYAAALLFGLYLSRRHLVHPIIFFLLASWITSIAALGIAGPSLTRLLIVLPAMLVFAALGFAGLAQIHSKFRIVSVALILVVGVTDGYGYLSGRGAAPDYYAAATTAIGHEALALAGQGRSVLCIVSSDANVTRFMTLRQGARVRVFQLTHAIDAYDIPWNQLRPDVLLVENDILFKDFVTKFAGAARLSNDREFFEIPLDAARTGRDLSR